MARPSKPFRVIEAEKKSHRTKAELESRKKGEEALASGIAWKEWDRVKTNKAAHKEFLRLEKVFRAIEKNDALHQNIINRYCLLFAEIDEYEEQKNEIKQNLHELSTLQTTGETGGLEYLKLRQKFQAQLLAIDKRILTKQKMMFDIEKENIMTVAAVLRSVPKRPPEEEEDDPMTALLGIRR